MRRICSRRHARARGPPPYGLFIERIKDSRLPRLRSDGAQGGRGTSPPEHVLEWDVCALITFLYFVICSASVVGYRVVERLGCPIAYEAPRLPLAVSARCRPRWSMCDPHLSGHRVAASRPSLVGMERFDAREDRCAGDNLHQRPEEVGMVPSWR